MPKPTKSTEQRTIEKLRRDKRKLRKACMIALSRLETMTIEDFFVGRNKSLREMLSKIIEETK